MLGFGLALVQFLTITLALSLELETFTLHQYILEVFTFPFDLFQGLTPLVHLVRETLDLDF